MLIGLFTFTAPSIMGAQKARAFVTSNHFHPNLMFEGKGRSITLKVGLKKGHTRVGSSLAYKYLTWVEQTL